MAQATHTQPLPEKTSEEGEEGSSSRPQNGQERSGRGEPTLFQLLSEWVKSSFGGKDREESVRESLESVIEEHRKQDTLPREEAKLLRNILEFSDLRADDVMIPRSDIIAVARTVTLEELKDTIDKEEHTRMPVYDGTLDNVIGFLHVKDLVPVFTGKEPFRVEKFIRKIPAVAPSMKTLDLLVKMRTERVHIAIVVDEYGGTDGLITLEDLFEEIVGEIHDEHDVPPARPSWRWLKDGSLEAEARLELDEFQHLVGRTLASPEEEEEIDTLGGLIFSLAGKMPAEGEIIEHPAGVSFRILKADPRRIHKVQVLLGQDTERESA